MIPVHTLAGHGFPVPQLPKTDSRVPASTHASLATSKASPAHKNQKERRHRGVKVERFSSSSKQEMVFKEANRDLARMLSQAAELGSEQENSVTFYQNERQNK